MYPMNQIERCLNREEILVAGHRGMKALYPENTLFSMGKALRAGVDMIETDLNRTKDGEIVLLHDLRVDRTTTGSGPVGSMTLKELKSLDAGSPFSPEYRGLAVPTLREFCAFLRTWPELLLNIEFKDYARETMDEAVSILGQEGLLGRCVFACFHADVCAYLHDAYGLKVQGFPEEYMIGWQEDTYSKLFAVGISLALFADMPNMRVLTPETVREFEELGLEPWCFCPDDERSVEWAVACGAKLMTCNNPLPALRVLEQRGLHPRRIAQGSLPGSCR